MKKLPIMISFFLATFFSLNAIANDEFVDLSDGLEVKITKVHGYQLGHDPFYPADGIGTTNYLTTVCQSLGYDDFVWDFKREWVERAKFVYIDMATLDWKKRRGPGLIYKYIVCKVYVR